MNTGFMFARATNESVKLVGGTQTKRNGRLRRVNEGVKRLFDLFEIIFSEFLGILMRLCLCCCLI